MQKQCQNCRKKVSDDLFICPHCGAILGAPVRKAPPVPKMPKERKQRRQISIPWLGPVLMLLLVVSLALLLPKYLKDLSQTPPTEPTQQTLGPLVTYNVQVKVSNRNTLKGVLIEIYLGDKVIDSCVTGSFGKASFTLPENDAYRLKLSNLPFQHQLNYGDTYFSIPEGQRDLVIQLENKPIPYVVKIINQAGEPLAGVSINILGTTQITGDDGCCTFEAKYSEDGYDIFFNYVPTGYYLDVYGYHFAAESTELVITLRSVDEPAPEGKTVYTVRVVDDYGAPIPNASLLLYYKQESSVTQAYRTANNDGWFAFLADQNQECGILLYTLPDYSEEWFFFEEGSNELLIELDLEREEYTYTFRVVDQYGDPYPGFEIYHVNSGLFAKDTCYITDENGIVTFTSKESDPTKVAIYTLGVPGNSQFKRIYNFPENSRKLTVTVDRQFVYTVHITDQNGKPVSGAAVELTNSNSRSYYAKSDEDGMCYFYLWLVGTYQVRILNLPDGYTDPIQEPQWFEYGSKVMIWTVISTTEPAE